MAKKQPHADADDESSAGLLRGGHARGASRRGKAARKGDWSFARWVGAAVTLSLLVGFFAGRATAPRVDGAPARAASRDEIPRPPGDTTKVFKIDEDFIGPPSELFEARWRSVIPAGRGFLSHPALEPDVKAFSVFHQLHCLYSLTTAFYAVADGAGLEDVRHGLPLKVHVGHCTEFLRQALMCHADVNLEDVPDVKVGATGWGFARTCGDFEAVKAFAERWAYGNGTGIG